MAVITLRDYVREIEKQIDGGRAEEAIAHSRHILETYPKCVDAYRLLGKAFLETQRYGDAGDIFQRVLSSIPDDFVAHVGMSIIREDEGNLDESIWHMERAYEVQPSNGAIQEELRRLYNRRDNVEPPKIRLTRGALARMYFKGDLHQQAIAEVRAALAEDPDRLDLQVLLANIYSQAGMRAEAADMANNLLQRLPYCLVANRVMVDILTASDRSSEADQFRQRMNQLDPYAVHISPNHPDIENVPDNAIKIDRLDYKPGAAPQSDQPTWASSLGVDLGKGDLMPEAPLPDWLSPLGAKLPESTAEPAAFQPSTPAFDMGDDFLIGATQPPVTPEQQAVSAEEIPDWMQAMGWQSITEEGRLAEAGYKFDESEAPSLIEEGELAAAEIPDWLKSMAPEEAEPAAPVESEEDVTPWLEGLMGETPAAVAHQVTPATPIEEAEGMPDWLAAVPSESTESPAESAEALPDWLSGSTLETAEPSGEPSIGAETLPDWLSAAPIESTGAVDSAESIPDWLSGLGGAAVSEFAQKDEAAQPVPDWLSGEIMEPSPETTPQPAAAEELPDWLSEAPVAIPTPKESQVPQAVEPSEEGLPDWMLEAAEAEATKPAAISPTGEEEWPDWLLAQTGQPARPQTPVEEPISEVVEVAPTAEVEEVPGWLREAGDFLDLPEEEAIEASAEIQEEVQATPAEALPEWLMETAEVAGVQEEAPAAPAEGLPEWLMESESSAEIQEETPTTPAEALPEWLMETAEATGVQGEAPAAPAEGLPEWLMEAETPAEIQEETPVAPAETLPEWLMETAEVAGVQEEAPTAPAEGLPEWLMGAEEPAEVQEEAPSAPAEGLPEWLMEAETPVEIQEEAPAAPAEGLPEWLTESQESVGIQEETPAAPAEGLPEWLLGTVETTGVQEEVPASPAETLPEWLMETAETSGVQEEVPASPAETLPEWLMETAEPAGVQEETRSVPAEVLPEWLMEAEEPVGVQEEVSAAPTEALPEWLMEAVEPTEALEETPAAPVESLPEWLMETTEPVGIQEETPTTPADVLPEWLTEAEEPIGLQEEVPAAMAEGLPEWLMETAEPGGIQEEMPAAPTEGLPEWLMEAEEPVGVQEETPAVPVESLPEWLMGAGETTEVQEEAPAAPEETIPDWLMGTEAPIEVEEEALTIESEIDLGDTQPTRIAHASEITAESPLAALPEEEPEEDLDEAFAWLDQLLAPVEPGVPAESVEMAEPAAPVEIAPVSEILPPVDVELQDFTALQEALKQKPEDTATPSIAPTQPGGNLLDADDAFAWLEALAVKQGASEALLLKPEDRTEKPPEWIQHELEEAGSLLQAAEPLVEPQVEAIEPPTSEVELTIESGAEIPASLTEVETPIETEAWEAQAPSAEVEMPSAPVETVEIEEPAYPDIQTPPVTPPDVEMPGNIDDAFAWLEALAVKQGATEALLLTPEERVETPPDWVLKQEVELPTEPEAQVVVEEPAPQPFELPVDAMLEGEAQAAIEPEAEALAAPELEVDAPATIAPQAETPTVIVPEAETPINPDDAFAWLEALAVKQGATEALLLTPEERVETPPDWVLKQEAESTVLAPDFAAPPGLSSMIGTEEISLLEPEAGSEIVEAVTSEIGAPIEQITGEIEPPVEEIQPVVTEAIPSETIEPPEITIQASDTLPVAPSAPTVETVEPVQPKITSDTGELPPLPDWLAGEATEAVEETEWTPPPVAKRLYDLNRASLGELERLPGVGFIMAQRIVMYREQHGAFESINDLLKVPEFSPTTLEDIRDNLFVSPPTVKPKAHPLPKDEPTSVLISTEGEQPDELAPVRGLLEQGDLASAVTAYNGMIMARKHLNYIVKDLQEAAKVHPEQPIVWQALGDAYIRLDQVREAMEAYTKAEQLLR